MFLMIKNTLKNKIANSKKINSNKTKGEKTSLNKKKIQLILPY